MDALVIYLLKANVIISLLFAAYLLLLKNQQSFYANRAFLLCITVLAVTLPFVPALNFNSGGFPHYIVDVNPINGVLNLGKPVPLKEVSTYPVIIHQAAPGFFSLMNIISLLAMVYVLVAVVLACRFLFQLFNLFFLIKNNHAYRDGDVVYCEHNKTLAPFSFFNIMVINQHNCSYDQLEQIIIHEKVHMRQWHSVDVLLAEMLHILLWMNPLMILFKRYTKLNLEYIADYEALQTGIDRKQYQLSILHNSVNLNAYPLTNLFSSSKIKNRIKMINSEKTSASKWYKYVFILPLILISYFIINPANGSAARKMSTADNTPLKAFAGYYQLSENQYAIFDVRIENDKLMAKNLNEGTSFLLTRKSDLTFTYKAKNPGEKDMSVTFAKNDAGEITQGQILDKGLWIKVKNYKPIKPATLSPEQLKAFEGKYQFETKKNAFFVITTVGGQLNFNTLWDGKNVKLVAIGENEFLYPQNALHLKFKKDSNGKVTQAIAFDHDIWDKVN